MRTITAIRSHAASIGAAPEHTAAKFTLPVETQAAEAAAARLALPQLAALQRQHPQWMGAFDDADTDTASVATLLDLLKSAPSEFAFGLVFGKLTLRAQIDAMDCASRRLTS